MLLYNIINPSVNSSDMKPLSEDNKIIPKKKNVLVSTYSMNKLPENKYMNKLIELCSSKDEYGNKLIIIPVDKWLRASNGDIKRSPLGYILNYMKSSPVSFKNKFSGFIFVFYNSNNEYFILRPENYSASKYSTIENLIRVLNSNHKIHKLIGDEENKSPVKDVIDKKAIEKEELEAKKKELVSAVASATQNAESEEEAWAALDEDDNIKKILAELEEEDDGKPKFNNARTSRMAKLNDAFLDKSINGRTVRDIMDNNFKYTEIPVKDLKVSSINEEWKDVRFANFQDVYDINSDILAMLQSLSTKTYPVSVIDIKVEDTSTNQDYIDTYTVQMEDGFGKRFSLVFDIPKFKNNRFMRLRGNDKVMSGQLLLLPCLKTNEDEVQCVSNYNKIFIYRHGMVGKSYPSSDRLIKALRKTEDKSIKVFYGDNRTICTKYELPIDYIDLASQLNRIETKDTIFYFSQDIYYRDYNADPKLGIPYGILKNTGTILYYKDDGSNNLLSYIIARDIMKSSNEFKEIFNKTKPANKMSYSEAKILSNRIPLCVIIGYSLGMDGLFNVCKIQKKTKKDDFDPNKEGEIKFKDGSLIYPLNYETSMMFNGLCDCPTEGYSLADINKRSMWLDFLDEFGGRILSDGLDNFADMFIDPITEEVCNHCKIPSNYFEMLVYANNLLADNKYNRHTDISGNRYRTNELVAGYFYKALSKSYTDYKIATKKGRKIGMSMKRSAIIDGIMQDPMSSDLSIMSPLLEIEAGSTVSFKGLSGMNSERSYSLDKRTYDDSMVNKLALSTGFAANVGINRQTTIDMDVEGKRGYVKSTNPDDMSVTKSFNTTEAITPFGTTRDDPFRSAMTFIQTSKHSMRTEKSSPLLITNGADEAIPHMVSDVFAFKAKESGEVIEIVPNEYMIIHYNNPIKTIDNQTIENEYISLKKEVKKNSDGGFYITLQLSTDYKIGQKFKKNDIIAYDKLSFTSNMGEDDNLAYNVGTLAKVVIMNTDEGFEDSTSISEWLSKAMGTEVVTDKDVDISAKANVYDMVKVGQEVQEGDPLIVFQNSYEEEDANLLLKSITNSDAVSDLGRVRLKSKYTGVIQDIKIYRTCELEDMSESLKRIVSNYEKEIKKRKAMYKKYGIQGANQLDPDYKMSPTGIMKNNQKGVKIVFYIKYEDELSVGDKVVAQSANKGVVKNVIPKDLTPFSEFRPNEQIHAMFASRSFNARMVTSVWISGAINKCLIELDRKCKDILGIEWEPIEKIVEKG